MRLQKFLAQAGITSRRKAENLIEDGEVQVNGTVVTELGTKVDIDIDTVMYDGKKVTLQENKVYILCNKPIGYVTTVEDQFSRDSILDLVKVKERIVPVGRLDMYTSGALLLSNDGDFIYQVTHPKHEIEKGYVATVKGIIQKEDLEKLKVGVDIGGYVTKPARVKILKTDEEKNQSRINIVIHEGKNRQVRKMCEAIGYPVIALHRSEINGVGVKDIPLGKWRYLNKQEINRILNK